MKYLMKFEKYHQNRVDEILDKINKNGIDSLTKIEKDYLDAFGKDDKKKMIELDYEARLRDFKSTDGYFHFTFSHSEDYGDEGESYFGTITVPSLEFDDGEILDGRINGYIQATLFGNIPFFEKEGYDIIEFCNGLEYELDNFIDYIIDTLKDEKNNF